MSANRDSFPDLTLEANDLRTRARRDRKKGAPICNKRAPLNEMDARAR